MCIRDSHQNAPGLEQAVFKGRGDTDPQNALCHAAVQPQGLGPVSYTHLVDAALFDAFDYVALGHLHSPQKVGRETLRY